MNVSLDMYVVLKLNYLLAYLLATSQSNLTPNFSAIGLKTWNTDIVDKKIDGREECSPNGYCL